MTLRPRESLYDTQDSFWEEYVARGKQIHVLTFAIFSDFELLAVHWQRPEASIPSSETL